MPLWGNLRGSKIRPRESFYRSMEAGWEIGPSAGRDGCWFLFDFYSATGKGVAAARKWTGHSGTLSKFQMATAPLDSLDSSVCCHRGFVCSLHHVQIGQPSFFNFSSDIFFFFSEHCWLQVLTSAVMRAFSPRPILAGRYQISTRCCQIKLSWMLDCFSRWTISDEKGTVLRLNTVKRICGLLIWRNSKTTHRHENRFGAPKKIKRGSQKGKRVLRHSPCICWTFGKRCEIDVMSFLTPFYLVQGNQGVAGAFPRRLLVALRGHLYAEPLVGAYLGLIISADE